MEQEKNTHAQALAGMRRQETYRCQQCGIEFTARWSATNPTRFCSGQCRYKAYVPIRKEKRHAAKLALPATPCQGTPDSAEPA